MFSSALRIFTRSLCLLATVAVFSTSCSRQPEGERCDYDWAGPTQDCASGLSCTPCGNLQSSVVDRCCRVDGTYADPRCAPAAAPNQISCNTRKEPDSNTGGKAGSAGAGAGRAGSAASGGSGATAGSGETVGNAGEATAGSGS
jgi:hypothetical protein